LRHGCSTSSTGSKTPINYSNVRSIYFRILSHVKRQETAFLIPYRLT